MTLIFAHRGVSGRFPENTMVSFKEADRLGADGIELDVQLSKDGEIVVIHDEKVNRTTNGKGYVKDFTVKELKKLDASYKFKKGFFKKKIPTLLEVFDWMKYNALICNIELKNNVLPYDGLEKKVIQAIREYQFEKRVILSSFNHYSLVECNRLAPNIETAPLYSSGIYMPWDYAKTIKANGIHPKIVAAPDAIIKQSQHEGISVRPYTVNDQDTMTRLINIQCAGFFTDNPEKALTIRKQLMGK